MTERTIQPWLQYTHLEKLYGYLPGMPDAVPAVLGLTAEEYETGRARFAARAAAAAAELLADPEFAARVDVLPFHDGQTVFAVGDSVTDDLQSWAEILRFLLQQRSPDLGVRVVNGGLSAHTTAMILRRWPATVATIQPDWILCGLGGNDVTRVGPEPTTTQVSLAESVANLRQMHAIAPDPEWVWLTPVPVREDQVASFPAFRLGGSTWRNDDIRALADAMRGLDGTVVDLVAAFGVPPDSELLNPDGVHPTLAGQSAIVRRLVETLTSQHCPDSP